MNNPLSLSELNAAIGQTIQHRFNERYWVKAELYETSIRNGHCYCTLVEKGGEGGLLAAKIQANCWANLFGIVRPYFEQETGQTWRPGLQLLLQVTVHFHTLFGLSLQIQNIDPTYTLGDLARQRKATLERLEAEGVMRMNKLLPLPTLPKRIAVISSDSAAGYGDFMHQLAPYQNRYAIRTTLFPAIMQGDNAERSILKALEEIYAAVDRFDALVMIRGGGSSVDLACFDSYELALHCAQFPLPIIVGIGHQRDVSILDMVANSSVKTPTAAAEFLIEHFTQQEARIEGARNKLIQINRERHNLAIQQIDRLGWRLQQALRNHLQQQHAALQRIEKEIALYSPERILNQGYTITLLNGKPIQSVQALRRGAIITTEFADGTATSTVT